MRSDSTGNTLFLEQDNPEDPIHFYINNCRAKIIIQ